MKKIHQLSDQQRQALLAFRRETIMFPKFEEAYSRVSEILEQYRQIGLAGTIAVYGESGCGKTTVCKVIEGENPRVVDAERDVVPVLYASIPAMASIGSVAESLLTKLKDPLPSKGTTSALTNRIVKQIEGCGVCLVILDELQHVHDRGQSPSIYRVTDWIKEVLDKIACSVALVGIPRAEMLVETNDQYRRRFSASVALDRMTLESSESEADFVALVEGMIEALPLECDLNLDPESRLTVERLYHATDGRVGYLASLLYRALLLAFLSDARSVSRATLERAFIEQIWRNGVGKLNPFHNDFCGRRLDKPGEPYAEAYPVGRKRRRTSPTGGDAQ